MRKRVFRVIQYEGDADWVERTIANSVHGKVTLGFGTITAVTVGEFGETIEAPEDERSAQTGRFREELGNRMPGQIGGSRGVKTRSCECTAELPAPDAAGNCQVCGGSLIGRITTGTRIIGQ